jgi:hypothetical protein
MNHKLSPSYGVKIEHTKPSYAFVWNKRLLQTMNDAARELIKFY